MLFRLKLPREYLRIHAHGKTGVVGVVHIRATKKTTAVNQVHRPNVALMLCCRTRTQGHKRVFLMPGRAPLAENAVFTFANRRSNNAAFSGPGAFEVHDVIAVPPKGNGGCHNAPEH